MKEQNKAKWHKSIRIALVALLAVVLVAAFVAERTNLTRAGDEAAETVAQESMRELVEEASAPEPAADPDPAPAAAEETSEEEPAVEASEEASEPAEAVTEAEEPAGEEEVAEEPAAPAEEEVEETAAPVEAEATPEATAVPAEVAAPEATAVPAEAEVAPEVTLVPEETLAPEEEEMEEEAGFANAEEDKEFRTGYAYTLGSVSVFSDRKETHEFANLPEGAVVRVTKRVEIKRDGEVVETWMGVRFMAEENEEGDLVNVEGFVPAWSLMQLDEASYLRRVELYARSLEENVEAEGEQAAEEGEEVVFEGDPIETSDGIPVVRVRYIPVPVEEAEEVVDEIEEEKPAPRVEVSFEHEGDELVSGTTVTLHAKLINMPEDEDVQLQWKNNATGEFEAVSGATSDSYAFQVDANNIDWKWVMEVRIGSDA